VPTSLLPFVFALLWASSYAAAKIGLIDATPFALVAARLGIAAAAAAVLVTAMGRTWPAVDAGRICCSAARCCTASGFPWRTPR
jgi:drug/metabolite transporter (DMT)-like permease